MNRSVAILRIFFGLVFLTNGLAKLIPGIAHLPGGYFLIDSEGARSIIQHNARHHPVTLYHDLVFNVLVPNWSVIGPMVGLTETLAGLLIGAINGGSTLVWLGLAIFVAFLALWLYWRLRLRVR